MKSKAAYVKKITIHDAMHDFPEVKIFKKSAEIPEVFICSLGFEERSVAFPKYFYENFNEDYFFNDGIGVGSSCCILCVNGRVHADGTRRYGNRHRTNHLSGAIGFLFHE